MVPPKAPAWRYLGIGLCDAGSPEVAMIDAAIGKASCGWHNDRKIRSQEVCVRVVIVIAMAVKLTGVASK